MTIISAQTPYGYTTFFDDLRQETNGKLIYTGVYTGIMLVPMVPFLLPSFVAMVTYRERRGESVEPVTLKLFVPGVTEAFMEMPLPVEQMRQTPLDSAADYQGVDRLLSMQIPLAFSPFLISAEGSIRIRAYRGGDEIRLGALHVQLARPVSPEPATHSPNE